VTPRTEHIRWNTEGNSTRKRHLSYPPLLLGGPTGSGKNQLALAVAAFFPAEIINADSRQIYQELPVGTNQPSAAERKKVPHHLFAFIHPSEPFSAPQYEKLAVPLIEAIVSGNRLPLLVGGTGFYMKAVLKGSWLVPPKDPDLRKRFQDWQARHGTDFLHKVLFRVDRDAAAKIPAADTYRVIRALEIFFQSGMRSSSLQHQKTDRFHALKFYLEPSRDALQARLQSRLERMFAQGWIEEVRHLLQKYPDFESFPAAQSIGYREAIRLIDGEIDEATCKQLVLRKTLQYAKRQLTWFRNQDEFKRLNETDPLHEIRVSIEQFSTAKSAKNAKE